MPDKEPTEILDSILQNCPFGFLRVDASGTVRAWSSEASNLLGWSAEEMIGNPAPEPIAAAAAGLASRLLYEGQLNHTLNCLKRGGGSIEVRLRFTVFR